MTDLRLKQLEQDGAADGDVLTWDDSAGKWVPAAPSGGGGGGGSTWDLVLDLPLTSLTDWTQTVGTWSIHGTSGQLYSANAGDGRIHYDRAIIAPDAPQVVEVEFKIDSDTGSWHRAGIIPAGSGGSGSGQPVGYVYGTSPTTTHFAAETDGTGLLTTIDMTDIAYGTWHTLRLKQLTSGGVASVWVNDTYIGDTASLPWSGTPKLGLYTLGLACHFRNLKVWQIPGPGDPPF